MNKSERRELEVARQKGILWHNEAGSEQARLELSRTSCGKGCLDCDPTSCPRAKRVDAFEIPE